MTNKWSFGSLPTTVQWGALIAASIGVAALLISVHAPAALLLGPLLASMALEKLFDPIGFVILLVYGVLAFQLPPQFERWKVPAEILLVVIVLLLAFFVYATRHIKPEHVPERRARPRTAWGRVKAYFKSFGQTAGRLATGPRFIAAILLSLASWACQLWTFELAAAAAHVSIPLAGSLACLLGINVGLIIRATPGNVGFFQFVYALMAEQFGVAANDAIAVSLLIQTLQILPLTLLGIVLAPEFIFRRGKKDKETEAVAKKIEKEKELQFGPLSTAEEVLQRATKAGVAPPPPPKKR